MPSTIQSLNCPFSTWNCAHRNSQIEIRHVKCEKLFFGYKMNSTLLTDASLQSIKLIQAYVFHMYIIFRVMPTLLSHWFPLKPSPTSKLLNQTTSRSCTTTLQVYKIHTTAFYKKCDLLVPVLGLFSWSRNRFVRFTVHFTVIPTSTIPPDLLDFEFRVAAIRNIKWNKMKTNKMVSNNV